MSDKNEFLSILNNHTKWRLNETLNLMPSENITSTEVRRFLSSDLGHRYTLNLNRKIHGVFIKNAYSGTKFTDQIEKEAESLAKKVFNTKFCTLKPLSGHIAGLIMLLVTCNRGDHIMIIHEKDGGYDGYMPDYMPKFLGLKVDYLPFNDSEWNVDSYLAAKQINKIKPKLVLIGASFILFPYQIKSIRDACTEVGAFLGYDASHVLGLIAGGQFQKPIKDGIDIISGSTHKTFFGPQGGLIYTNREDLFEIVNNKLTWHTIDNAHQNRIGALGQALLEMDHFGKDYSKQVVINAKILAKALDTSGIPIKFSNIDYTQSHQVLLDINKIKNDYNLDNLELMTKLERENILIDCVGRIGVNEMTRRGCFEDEMFKIAELIKRVIIKNEKNVKKDVFELLRKCKIYYCFS